MYLSELIISGYRGFGDKMTISLNSGLNVIVGENGCGKSTIIDSIRLLLYEDEYSRYGVSYSDFHRNTSTDEQKNKINIKGVFTDLTEEQKSIYLTWINNNFDAQLNLVIENTYDGRYNFKKKVWGGLSSNSIFDWEAMNDIQCVYLPPLRDAERRLRSSRGSRLARLLINLSKNQLVEARDNDELLDIEEKFKEFNLELEKDENIDRANELINQNLKDSLGNIFGQSTKIQFNQINFERIVESLKLLYHPMIIEENNNVQFRDLSENSLGYNNLIYLATILAEFEGLRSDNNLPRILLIEEPEAHLHPQLQIKLLKYLESQAQDNNIQIIVSTHSPTIASSVSLKIIKLMCLDGEGIPKYIPLNECGLEEKTEKFLDRWLDITKSTLLFSRAVILVEGLAESLLIPKLASIVLDELRKDDPKLPITLEEAGISVINMNGIYFDHFMQLYNGYKINKPNESKNYIKQFIMKDQFNEGEYSNTANIPVRCVGITDNDPKQCCKPTYSHSCEGNNRCLYLKSQLKNMTDNCRLFYNLKTFEYDLALNRKNLKIMIGVLLDNLETEGDIEKRFTSYKVKLEGKEEYSESVIADMAFDLLKTIDTSKIGKGLYAQLLYEKIDNDNLEFVVPEYIKKAIKWVVEIKEGVAND